ncbi:hypothetical protein RSOL_326010, partial [Rhizoctonia solani AG-3 Rhs1AP]
MGGSGLAAPPKVFAVIHYTCPEFWYWDQDLELCIPTAPQYLGTQCPDKHQWIKAHTACLYEPQAKIE